MSKDLNVGPLIVVFALLGALSFAFWGAVGNQGHHEALANQKYEESITLKQSGLKTIILVDGVERDDCSVLRGAQAIYCRPPLTPEEMKASPPKKKAQARKVKARAKP